MLLFGLDQMQFEYKLRHIIKYPSPRLAIIKYPSHTAWSWMFQNASSRGLFADVNIGDPETHWSDVALACHGREDSGHLLAWSATAVAQQIK